MIPVARAFHDVAVRRSLYSPFRNLLRPETPEGRKEGAPNCFFLELTRKLSIEAFEPGQSLSVPMDTPRAADANVCPNRGYDQARYVLRTDPKGRGEAFWARLVSDFEAAGLPDYAKAAKRAADLLLAERLRSGKVVNFRGTAVGFKAWVVPTVEGKPCLSHAKFRRFWSKRYDWRSSGTPSHTDLITGDPCRPVMPCKACDGEGEGCKRCRGSGETVLLHRQADVYGAGGTAPLLSYDKAAFTYDDRDGGLNFPVALRTAETYVAGFRYLTSCAARVGKDVSLLAWCPDLIEDPPIVLLARQVIDREAQFKKREVLLDLWRQIEEASCGEDRVSLIVLRAAKARVSVLGMRETTARQLRSALLAFRDDFQEVLSAVNFPRVLNFSHVEVERKDGCGAIRGFAAVDALWSVVLGIPYSRLVESRAASARFGADEQTDSIITAWAEAYRRRAPHTTREEGGLMTVIPEALARSFESVPEDMHYILDELKLGSRDQLHEVRRYGVLAACVHALHCYDRGDKEFEFNRQHLLESASTPNHFFGRYDTLVERWREKFGRDSFEPRNRARTRILIKIYELAFIDLGDWLSERTRLSQQEVMLFRQAFHKAHQWCRTLHFTTFLYDKKKKKEQASEQGSESIVEESTPIANHANGSAA